MRVTGQGKPKISPVTPVIFLVFKPIFQN